MSACLCVCLSARLSICTGDVCIQLMYNMVLISCDISSHRHSGLLVVGNVDNPVVRISSHRLLLMKL